MDFHRANNAKATPLSPVITIDRERCIACQRCTAYSERIEQGSGLVMLNRGFYNEVNTFNNEPYDTRYSGNVIDICPVGALTNTDFRFKARTWDLTNHDSLCAHCGVNCNITIGTRLNKLMRIEARPNDAVDDGWICDKGRWGHSFMESQNRITAARENSVGATKPTSFPNFPIDAPTEQAAEKVAEAFKKIVDEHGPESVGFIGSPYATNEESYLYQKMFRLLGTNNIDHKTYQDTPGLPIAHYDIEQIESSNIVLLIASDPTEELPILDLRIKKAVSNSGTRLLCLNDQDTALDKYADLKVKYKIGSEAAAVDALAEGLARELGESVDISATLDATGISADEMKSLVEAVRSSMKICVVYNPSALSGDAGLRVKRLLRVIAKIPTVECGAIPAAPATNAVGAMDMGLLPDFYPGGVSVADTEQVKSLWGEDAPTKPGLSALEMIEKAKSGELKALLVHRSNLAVDFPGGTQVVEALRNLDLLVVHDMLETETTELAKIVLPSNGPGFDEGTTTNIGGRVQARRKALDTDHIADWKLIRVMLKTLGDETDYPRAAKVLDEISKKVPGYQEVSSREVGKLGLNRVKVSDAEASIGNASADNNGKLRLRIATYLFAHDKILDASSRLAHHFKPSTVFLNEKDAGSMKVNEGDAIRLFGNGVEINAEVKIDNRCLAGGVVVPKISDEQGLNGLTSLDGSAAWVDIEKV
jgi:predicted molibdopterin-dependent oxidoreductase YjgC